MNIKINKILYSKDSEIEYLKVLNIANAYKYLSTKYIGYVYYNGELISLIGEKELNSEIAILLKYKNKKIALLIDDIENEGLATKNIKNYLEDLFNV